MGMARTRFGRNVPLELTKPEVPPRLFTPNPRTISDVLLLRHEFKPATTLNILAAAWLQFETRDWFSHGTDMEHPIRVPRPPGDDWPDDPMEWPSTPKDPTNHATDGSATFINTETHWWDASQVYGSVPEFEKAIRTGTGGRVRIGDDGLIDVDPGAAGLLGRPGRLVGGPRAHAHAVHARAQRDLRPARGGVPRPGTTTSCSRRRG